MLQVAISNAFGGENIEEGAMHQMELACRLPISVAGALMPEMRMLVMVYQLAVYWQPRMP